MDLDKLTVIQTTQNFAYLYFEFHVLFKMYLTHYIFSRAKLDSFQMISSFGTRNYYVCRNYYCILLLLIITLNSMLQNKTKRIFLSPLIKVLFNLF